MRQSARVLVRDKPSANTNIAVIELIRQVEPETFEGSHVSYGLFGSTEHGKVSGALRQ